MGFNEASLVVKAHEGGYGNDPNDSGGPTNFGITQSDLAQFRGHAVSADDVKNMSFDEAKLIYKKDYWDPLHLDQVLNPTIQTILFDQGILSGVGGCTKAIQQVVGVTVDGVIGPQTIAAINNMDPILLSKKFIISLQNRYIDIVLHNNTQIKFLKGWIARTQDLLLL